MKTSWILLAVVLLSATVGCETLEQQSRDRSRLNEMFVRTTNDAQINNAIVRQRTVFPYHFVPYSAELTELGERDLDVLAAYFQKHPGKLNVRQGDADDELYAARIEAVKGGLDGRGVMADRVAIADDLADGDGILSVSIVYEMERQREEKKASSEGTPAARSRGRSSE